MMRTILLLASILMLSGQASFAASPAVTYLDHHDVHAPQAYKDAGTGIIFYVESDGLHIAALSAQGKLLWVHNPFAEAHLESYRLAQPRISYIGPDTLHCKDAANPCIGITYNSSQFGTLDTKTGHFNFGGQD